MEKTIEQRFEYYLKLKTFISNHINKKVETVDKINVYSIVSVKQKLK